MDKALRTKVVEPHKEVDKAAVGPQWAVDIHLTVPRILVVVLRTNLIIHMEPEAAEVVVAEVVPLIHLITHTEDTNSIRSHRHPG